MLHLQYILFLFLLLPVSLIAQSISGKVVNAENEAIPYTDVYIQELQTGTSTDDYGNYFITIDVPGEYELIVSSLGYDTKTVFVAFEGGEIIQNIVLESSDIKLNEITVKASKRDPAYAIIKKVIQNKKKYMKRSNSYRTEVYVKATEILEGEENPKKKRKQEKKEKDEIKTEEENSLDIFAEAEKERVRELNKLSMLEMQLTLNYEYPKNYKEERTAYKSYGDKNSLFVPLFGETDFNFYRNMVQMTGIAETPVISPISKTSILSYKYKLVEVKEENGRSVFKIKVIPRKKGNATCSGYIYINDEIWNINRLDLSFYKGGLRFFDAFRLKQDYEQINDTLWIPNRLEFVYETKQGKHKNFKGNTTMRFSDYEHDVVFPNKFFRNELAVTTAEAYKRDSTYWEEIRPEPLKENEVKMMEYRDSIKAVRNSDEFKDSVEAVYNKITFMDVIWDGIGFQNHRKKQHIYAGSIPELIDFSIVGGFRFGPSVGYFRRWENGKYLNTFGDVDIGVKNWDVQGNASVLFQYNPIKRARVWMNGGRSFYSINSNDAFLNQLRTSNYILHDKIGFGHSFEIVNGLTLYFNGSYTMRKSVENYDTETFIDNIINDDAPPLDFEDYDALITTTSISYTPGQKYLREPNRKIILGSKYPTFSINHRKGWNKIISSDVDFDYVDFGITQDIILGSFGHSKYNFTIGKYLNTKDLKIVDLKRFRQSDPILYSNPLHSFQGLDTAFATTNVFIEFHHIHHFNGALVNNIPLVKKTKVRMVAGGGILWVRENKFRHGEIFAGLERVFKVGKRRRMRIGTYGVLAKSKDAKAKPYFKLSLDLIDTWKKDWSY